VTILAIDIGTTALKMGVFQGDDTQDLRQIREFRRGYEISVYNDGLFGDIEQHKWVEAIQAGCVEMAEVVSQVDVIALSGTTPGLSAMGADGSALYPAILMLDQRSRKQAAELIEAVGLSSLLRHTGNMPVAGGCSLAGILWLKENEPALYKKTACFGHSNSFVAAWLTGQFAIDPSSASLTGIYNTAANDLTWNHGIAEAVGFDVTKLPPVFPSHASIGTVRPNRANELGLLKRPKVIIGGNDAVLAAYSAGITEPGQTINVNGTCEITLVCLPECYASPAYNVRAHVVPGRWLTLYVMNAGGKAFEWFRSVFCSELSIEEFWNGFVPGALEKWTERQSLVEYQPYLLGSRYSVEPLRASFAGMTAGTTREELLAALVRGLATYQREHLKEIALRVPLAGDIYVTGGALNESVLNAKRKWLLDTNYLYREQSSLLGAAQLAVDNPRLTPS
jgi:xylulokinase